MNASERTVIPFKTEEEWKAERAKDITSTESAALFGVSPYLTEFELWHRKKNNTIVDIQSSERMKWGTRLEESIAKGISEDNGWDVRLMKEYIRNEDLKMGASFDFWIMDQEAILEIKNVDSLAFRDGWIVEDEHVEAPLHIEMQVQHQLAVAKAEKAYIGALIGGNKVVILERNADKDIISTIKKKIQKFWKSIDENNEPSPNFAKDAAFISKLYGYAEPGKILDATDHLKIKALSEQYRAFSEAAKMANAKKDAAKAELLMSIGDAEKVTSDLFTISLGMVKETEVSYTRKAYRNFQMRWKKK